MVEQAEERLSIEDFLHSCLYIGGSEENAQTNPSAPLDLEEVGSDFEGTGKAYVILGGRKYRVEISLVEIS